MELKPLQQAGKMYISNRSGYLIIQAILFKLLFLGCISVSAGQDIRGDLKKVGALYADASILNINLDVKLFKGASLQPYQSFKGKVRKHDNLYYSEIMEKVTIRNKKCILYIDKSNKMIMVSSLGDNADVENDFLYSVADSMFFINNKYRILNSMNNSRTIEFSTKQGDSPITRVVVTYDPLSYQLQYFEYSYKENASPEYTVKINYDNKSFSKKFNNEIFNDEQYIIEKGNKLIAQAPYTSFKLIDQRKK
jgi:hypothetical protein